jgi:uncharacterized damage-inducible protein DinB
MRTRELTDLLRHAYDGDPWHGPPLAAVLGGVAAGRAAARPVEDRHSIWELVVHLTAWTGEVERRLGGALAGTPQEGDWPPPAGHDDAAWRAALDALAAAHASLTDAVSRQPDTKWDEPVGDTRDPAAGTGVTFGVMIVGLATHHAYHAGQIALLR